MEHHYRRNTHGDVYQKSHNTASMLKKTIESIPIFSEINLHDILSPQDVEVLVKEYNFCDATHEEEIVPEDSDESAGDENDHEVIPASNYLRSEDKETEMNTLFDKNELILKFIKISIDKLHLYKENAITKGLEWAKNEIQNGLEYKPDVRTYKRFEQMKQTKPYMREKLNWMEEFSNLTIQQDLYKVTKNEALLQSSRRMSSIIPKTLSLSNYLSKKEKVEKQYSTNGEELSQNIYSKLNYFSNGTTFLNYSEDLANIESPNFDIFKLEQAVGKENTLSTVSCFIFISLGLYSIINYSSFETFVDTITKGYNRKNPYHTDLHAADVEQTCLIFALYGNMKNVLLLNDLDITSFFISAIIHDYKHPGVTNNFLINTQHEIALRYNDQSVLESFHVSEAFKIINISKESNIFSELSLDEYKLMRKRIVESVLATDMTLHNKEFQFLKLKIQNYSICEGRNVEKLFENQDNIAKFNSQQEFLNTLIHAADISNPTKPFDIYYQWAKMILEEFAQQGDREKQIGLTVSFLCDRETTKLPQAQIGFMEGIVLPLTQAIIQFFPGLEFLVENINSNRSYFVKLRDEDNTDQKK